LPNGLFSNLSKVCPENESGVPNVNTAFWSNDKSGWGIK
jgi:hypothetical protein